MRIALLCTTFPEKSQEHLLLLIKGLEGIGYEIHIVTEVIVMDRIKPKNITLFSFLITKSIISWAVHLIGVIDSLVLHPKKISRFLLIVNKENIKLKNKIKKILDYSVLIPFEYDAIHILYPKLATRRIADISAIFKCPIVVSFRGQDLSYFPTIFGPVFSTATSIHFISRFLYKQALNLGYLIHDHQIIPPFVDTEIFYSKNQATKENQKIQILTCARLYWIKGYEYSLYAIKILIDRGYEINYLIAGDGEGRMEVEYAIRDLGLNPYVSLIGWVEDSNLASIMRESDIYLLSSVDEGFNNSVIQAQSCGLPVVCTNVGGLPENIQDGVTGLLAKSRNPTDIADKLERLIKSNSLRLKMGKAGRNRALNLFEVSNVIPKFSSLYVRLAQKKTQ